MCTLIHCTSLSLPVALESPVSKVEVEVEVAILYGAAAQTHHHDHLMVAKEASPAPHSQKQASLSGQVYPEVHAFISNQSSAFSFEWPWIPKGDLEER